MLLALGDFVGLHLQLATQLLFPTTRVMKLLALLVERLTLLLQLIRQFLQLLPILCIGSAQGFIFFATLCELLLHCCQGSRFTFLRSICIGQLLL